MQLGSQLHQLLVNHFVGRLLIANHFLDKADLLSQQLLRGKTVLTLAAILADGDSGVGPGVRLLLAGQTICLVEVTPLV